MTGIKSSSVTDTYGAFLIGTYCDLMLYGVLLHQSYHYFRVYAADARWIKALLAVTLILETVVTALNINAGYNYLVTNYANPDLERPLYCLVVRPFAIQVIGSLSCHVCANLSSVLFLYLGAIAQTLTPEFISFFARRVWLIARGYRPIVYCSIVLMLAEFALPITPNVTDALNFSYLVSARNAAATVADGFMTAVLIYSLRRSRTGIKRTDSMINVLILYAINTGLLTSAFNVLCLVFGLAFPQSFTYIAVGIVATRLYANSLLAALTSRKLIAETGRMDTESDGPFGTVRAIPGPERSARRASDSVHHPGNCDEEWELQLGSMGGVLNVQLQSSPAGVLGSPSGEGGRNVLDEIPAKSVFLHFA